MKKPKYLPALIFSLIVFMACNTNSKLEQVSIEGALREFITFNNASENAVKLSILEVLNTEQVSQFSENEASCIATLKAKVANPRWGHALTENDYKEEELKIKLIFKKNVDNNWVLTSTEKVSNDRWYNNYMNKLIEQSQNLNIVAQ